MAYPTDSDYDNLRLDIISTGSVVNGAPNAANVVTRLGRSIKPLAKLIAEGEAVIAGVEQNAATEADRAEAASLVATAEADRAVAAAALFTFEVGVFAIDDAGVNEGQYYADFSVPYNLEPSRVIGQVKLGTGQLDAVILVDGVPMYGPVTLTDSEYIDLAPVFDLTIGQDVDIVVQSLTGDVRAFFLKFEGIPA